MNNLFKAYLSAYHNEVTGSRFLLVLERPDKVVYRILIDYGYYQEPSYRYLNYVDDINPEKIDAIIVTHNHIDHTGLVPKAVKQGYKNNIYMTNITEELIQSFWMDCADQQEGNAQEMREQFPLEASKFRALYHREDVNRAMKKVIGLAFGKTLEILPGIKLTFFENGHILGAGFVLLQCSYLNMDPVNFFFTGDMKPSNCFFRVHKLPKWLKKKELILVCESTYGTTTQSEIKRCFKNNIIEAMSKRQNILIGAFAQGRMQEILYEFKLMQEEGLIPKEYVICLDGSLGIETTFKYQKILEWYNPYMQDFLPEGLTIVNPKSRNKILESGNPKILITTSGMLSNGPAHDYVPIFLEHSNAMIHLVGYAAEETAARKLLEAKHDDSVQIFNHTYKKHAIVKTTREKTSHATKEQLIEFINAFENVKFLGINHGNTDVKNTFAKDVSENCTKVEQIGIFDRTNMYCFYRVIGKNKMDKDSLILKQMPAGLINNSKILFGRENSEKTKKKFTKSKKNVKRKSDKRKKKTCVYKRR